MRLLILATATALTLSACAQSGSGGFQSSPQSGYVLATEVGVIKSKLAFEISTGGTGLGPTVGAIAGGIGGSFLGPGRSRRRGFSSSAAAVSALGSLGGAVAGGLLGYVIEDGLSRKIVTEYVVQLNDGSLVTIVQDNGTLTPGQRVYLQTTQGGFGQLVPGA